MTVERVLLNQAMIALLIMVSNVSSAYFSPLDDIRDSVSDQIKDYYVIEESKIISEDSNNVFQDPYSMLTLQDQQPVASAVDLLNWKYISRSFSQPEEHYNRKKHFGGWVSDPNDNSCFNTGLRFWKGILRHLCKPVPPIVVWLQRVLGKIPILVKSSPKPATYKLTMWFR